eukprot:TRINITY_DN3654_c0_g1_i1.p1 TRINITY_DN3654_c0_g1~~TRINITY_DN3654_c0_g1_i1.p1  ORF type:complete len:216 (+),score=57.93 TRINITY_DN3654_c0_g1_i1:82-648(+)
MYVFGGYDNMGMACDDLYQYDIEKNTWKRIRADNSPPSRFQHTAVHYKQNMCVFGGLGDASAILQDFYVFNIETNKWSKLVSKKGKAPSSRFGHGAVMANQAMIVMGGCGKDREAPYDDIFCFNFTNKECTEGEWQVLDTIPSFSSFSSLFDEDKGRETMTMGPRYHHAFLWDDLNCSIFIHGGKVQV